MINLLQYFSIASVGDSVAMPPIPLLDCIPKTTSNHFNAVPTGSLKAVVLLIQAALILLI